MPDASDVISMMLKINAGIRLCLKVGQRLGDVGRGEARCGTRGRDIGDVNKTYRCS